MTAGKRILLVEDDALLRQSLRERLEAEGFAVDEADRAAAALDGTGIAGYDLMLLDVGLPDMDGRALCQELRRRGVRAPIIMLTAADTGQDIIAGLDSGASDHITKPFRLGALLARLRAHLRQFENSQDAHYVIGPYRFQPADKCLVDGRDRRIRLTEKEVAILRFLCRAGDRVIARDVLLNEIWGYNAGITTHTLETHVYRLRRKLEADPAHARLLVTEPGGYRLVM
ncbi:MAG: response regulator transcription factor [Rhodospirillales bacterium]|nr:response regulator transcription factor [Rhodospirillales bacterium]